MPTFLLALAATTAVTEAISPTAADTIARAMQAAFAGAPNHTIEFKLGVRDEVSGRESVQTGTLRLACDASGRWVGRGRVVTPESKAETAFAVRGGRVFELRPDECLAIDWGHPQAFGLLIGLLESGSRSRCRLTRTDRFYHYLLAAPAGVSLGSDEARLVVMTAGHSTIPRHLPRAFRWSDGRQTEYFEVTNWRVNTAGPTAEAMTGELDGWFVDSVGGFWRRGVGELAWLHLTNLLDGLKTLALRSVGAGGWGR